MGGRNRGGQKRGRTQRRHFRDGRQDVWKKQRPADDNEEQRGGWDPFVTESPAFELYYKKQGIVPEEEWDSFLAVLRKPLPAVFRVNSSGPFAMEIRTQIEEEFAGALNCEVDGEKEELVKPLPWYPGKFAWHLNFSRMQLRKSQTLSRLHEFLKRENEIGNITRQEAVSMVPPLFLDVQPSHQILDMCAAPGSKTFQMLEMIHKDDKKGSPSNGLVVANDVDVQRCHLLIHQTKRMCSPNVAVTNHEAQHFPGLRKEKEITRQLSSARGNVSTLYADAKSTAGNEERGIVFDRILCDVPCSGDGTIRKAPDIWKKWNIGNANGLHRLQIQIAMRGVALLKVGGRLVYSTCSLNPVENEAVVGEVLRCSEGCLELLDVSDELPELKRRPGLKTWKVRDKGLWISSYRNVDKHRVGSILPSMFPTGRGQGVVSAQDEELLPLETCEEEIAPPEGEQTSEDNTPQNREMGETEDGGEIALLPLERCLRILPHDQDTGGFFVAVFRKVAALKGEQTSSRPVRRHTSARKVELHDNVEHLEVGKPEAVISLNQEVVDQKPSETENEIVKDVDSNEVIEMDGGPEAQSKTKPSRPQQQGNWKGVDPVLFLNDEALIDSIISFYGIKDSLPLRGHLVTRSEDTSRLKRIYYVSESVANLMKLNFRTGEQMKITSLGLKVFERQGGKEIFSQCAFRIASEGLPLLLPHLTRQLLRASKQDFKLLLSVKTTPFSAFSGSDFVASLQALVPGCCVVILDGENDAESQSSSVTAIGCWRGRSNLSLLIPKEEALQLLDRLFVDGEKDDGQSSQRDADAPLKFKDDDGKDVEERTDLETPLLALEVCQQEDLHASMSVAQAPI
ncbi:hypothetical protein GOP47_0017833 [Adiantum capillus-veneris]|uniref:SAM-dependent MTase RsmB/NOP-type domain-containing protein n=1 Tax=Adiantum capillus-veneris TaxID=13818 RepID=A0A9D4UGD3_ADICA|nr:hypothetical protein GOP47_0017833 [Adiantum capillus-veneris]